MTARRLAALVIVMCAIAVAAVALTSRETGPADRPRLLLLTSLPLMFGEQFSLDSSGSPALSALASKYDVVPISVTSAAELGKGKLLLMAHPLAQSPENLVALDTWVRHGGHALLLADPALEWPSERPLGDPLRPPPMFMDTGLLGHWGLRLDAPDARGPAERILAEQPVATVSPGLLYGKCQIQRDRLVANCRVGKGFASVIADADFLHPDDPAAARGNLDALLKALADLESR